jgi:hypothetical protein
MMIVWFDNKLLLIMRSVVKNKNFLESGMNISKRSTCSREHKVRWRNADIVIWNLLIDIFYITFSYILPAACDLGKYCFMDATSLCYVCVMNTQL